MNRQHRWKYVMYALMVVYVCYISFNLIVLDNLMESIKESSRRSLTATLKLRQISSDVEKSLPDLFPLSLASADEARDNLKREWAGVESARQEVEASFKTDPALLKQLDSALDSLHTAMLEAADKLEGNASYEVAEEFSRNVFAPQFQEIQAILNHISHVVSESMERTHEDMHVRIELLIAASIIAGGVIVSFTMLYDRRMEVAVKQIGYQQELFRQLANGIDDVFIVAVNADRYEFVPGSTRAVLNLPETEIREDPEAFYSLLEPEDAEWLKKVLNSGDLEESAERDAFAASLNKYLKFRVYSIFVPTVQQKYFTIVISDQTETILHNHALSDALESADAASAAKSGFLSHMSHEIRTPMNAIIGMTTIALSRINDSARVKDCLGKISDSSRHLLGLINDVLDMSKIESGKLAINRDNFNLHQVVDNINNIFRPQAQTRRQRFEILLEGVDEENLVGDAMRVNQVLLNLLSNAFKFTPEGGSIVLKLTQLEKKNDSTRIRFTISDTGIGMSEEFLERLYTPFEQASDSTASKYGGTGLGMPITANLVTMMGGSINVRSKEGEGTTFFVELPFGLSGEGCKALESLPQARILIVDDDEGTCEHASALLEKMGLASEWALSGEEGVNKAREAHESGNGFDVCLIDWTMPGMNGGETAMSIRQAVGDDMLIIIISSYDWASIEDEARRAGVNDFIAKPFFASTLHDALASATRKLEAEAGREPAASVKESFDFSGKRALLVEDNEFNREIGEEFLNMVNMEVDHAENGKEAVDKVLNSPKGYYDIVLMDIQMPVMDGYEATRSIRASSHADAQSMVILAMTANAFSEDVAKAVAVGMNGHIAKPIDVNELYRMLARHLLPASEEGGAAGGMATRAGMAGESLSAAGS